MSKLYKVQTGAFLIKRNAEKQAGNIISKTGLKTIIVQENAFYKVQVGAFSNKANAENVIKTLSKSGFIAKIFEYNVADTKETSTQIPEIEEKVIERPVLLATLDDIVSAEILRDILNSNSIPNSGSESSEGAMKVVFGNLSPLPTGKRR